MFLDEHTKTRLLKMSIGQRTENALYYLLAPHLLGYWTFLKPDHEGKELGDVLFVYGDVCIIFEVKAREKPGLANHVWIGSKLKEAFSQIHSNRSLLSSGQVSNIRNAWRGEISWSSLGVKYYHGIVVINHDSDPYDPREMEPILFASSKLPVHVVSLYDLNELLRFINTPWDFVVYWEFRHQFGKQYQLLVHKEESIYRGILTNWAALAKEQQPRHPESKLEEERRFVEGYTLAIMNPDKADDSTRSKIAASYLIDIAAINLMTKADQDETGKRVGSREHNKVVETIEAISDLSRRRRAEYGSVWLRCARSCLESSQAISESGFSPSRKRAYVFQARPGPQLDERAFLDIALITMAKNDASSCVALTATADNVIYTFESLMAAIMESEFKVNPSRLINVTAVFINRPD